MSRKEIIISAALLFGGAILSFLSVRAAEVVRESYQYHYEVSYYASLVKMIVGPIWWFAPAFYIGYVADRRHLFISAMLGLALGLVFEVIKLVATGASEYYPMSHAIAHGLGDLVNIASLAVWFALASSLGYTVSRFKNEGCVRVESSN